jgi:D-alanyl-lipoteichoic acid acyltransferase DltB (MBOAT superfamily)
VLASAVVFGVGALLGRSADPAARWRWANVALCALLAGFVIVQWTRVGGAPGFGGTSLHFVYLDMWLLLRLVNYLWEVGSGKAPGSRAAHYLLWVALPFTSIGPVLRYSELEAQLSSTEAAPAAWRVARWWRRLASGLALIAAGAVLATLQARMLGGGEAPPGFKVAAWLGTGPWGFLLTYSGFFSTMECLAQAWGLRLPPSFQRPFGQINLSRFWAGWNMTVTSLIRDYLFFNRWGFRRSNLYVNTVIVFAAVGLWHGVNGYWLIWGLLHGLGFGVFLAWRRIAERHRFEPPRLPAGLAGVPSRIATYLFVCACWVLPPQILAILPVPR